MRSTVDVPPWGLKSTLLALNPRPQLPTTTEPAHDKTYKMACAPSEDSDQPGHPPSLIRVFAIRMKKAWVRSYPLSGQRRLWSDWADAQADLSLRWAHTPFCRFYHAQAQLFVRSAWRLSIRHSLLFLLVSWVGCSAIMALPTLLDYFDMHIHTLLGLTLLIRGFTVHCHDCCFPWLPCEETVICLSAHGEFKNVNP